MLSLAKDNPFREEISSAENRLSELGKESLKHKEYSDDLENKKLKAQLWEAQQPYYRGSDLSEVAPLDYRNLRREQTRDK